MAVVRQESPLATLLRTPIPDRERYNREVVAPFYSDVEEYDWTDVVDHNRGPEALVHRLRVREVMRALHHIGAYGAHLDIGCGTGLLLRHCPAGSCGIDLNPRNVTRARRYAPHADVRVGNAEALPYASASFDRVLCTEVLEHLVFPERAVQEAFRVLRPGGVFLGSVPRRTWVWRLRSLSATCPANEPFHHEFFTDDLRQLLITAPFSRIRVWSGFWLLQLFFCAWRGEEHVP